MIRIAVMMDKARVIGASTPEVNEKRMTLLPKQLSLAMSELYQGENIAGGESSWKMPTSLAKKNRYVITRNADFDVEGEPIQIVTNANELIEKYQYSEEELLIVGGLAMFNFFVPYAQRLDIAESDELIPGDLVYDSWEKEPFELKSKQEWEGFSVLTYERNRSYI